MPVGYIFRLLGCERQGLHGLPDKGEVVALIGSKLLIQFVGFPYGIVVEPVLTEVRRDSQQPCLFMRSVFKNRTGLEVLDKRILKDVLGIAHVVQV